MMVYIRFGPPGKPAEWSRTDPMTKGEAAAFCLAQSHAIETQWVPTPTRLTVSLALRLGWIVQEGMAGLKKPKPCWRVRHRDWRDSTWSAKTHRTEAAALSWVEAEVAMKLDVSGEEFRKFLDELLESEAP